MKRAVILTFLSSLLCISGIAGNYNWCGFYAGMNAGCGFADCHVATSTQFSATGYFAPSSAQKINDVGSFRLDSNGFEGGIQVGYDWQRCHWVVGLETEFDAFSLDGKDSITVVYPEFPPFTFTIFQSVKTDWLYTLRPRFGYTRCNWLLYGTGGLCVTNIKYKGVFTDTFAPAHENASKKVTKAGWCLGFGVEYALCARITVKAEYLHTHFGKIKKQSNNLTAFNPPVAFPTSEFTHSAKVQADLLRFGINYRL